VLLLFLMATAIFVDYVLFVVDGRAGDRRDYCGLSEVDVDG